MVEDELADFSDGLGLKKGDVKVLGEITDYCNQAGIMITIAAADQRQIKLPALDFDLGHGRLFEAFDQDQVEIVQVGVGQLL